MLLIMAIALALISAFIEFKAVRNVAPIRWIFEKSWLAGFLLSMLLSLTLGWLFGMSGLVAAMGGIGSTVITDPVHAVNRRRATDEDFNQQFEEVKATYSPLLKLAKYAILSPFILLMIPVKCKRWVDSIDRS